MVYGEANYTMLYIIGAIAVVVVFGLLSSHLAEKRGYQGSRYFWIGFFLGVIGLLYIIGLPVKPITPYSYDVQLEEPDIFDEPSQKPQDPLKVKWQRGKYPAGLVALRLTYMSEDVAEFKSRVKRLLEIGYNEVDLYDCCVDEGMKLWLISAIEESE